MRGESGAASKILFNPKVRATPHANVGKVGSGIHALRSVFDRETDLLAAVFRKRGLYFTRVFRRSEESSPYTGIGWEGSRESWFATFDEAVAEALRLLKPGDHVP